MKQKFCEFTFVHVTKDMPPSMPHFDKDFDGIVNGTYSQIYGGEDVKSYSIYKLNKAGTRIVDRISWYKENQLVALPTQDRDKAEAMVEKYDFAHPIF